MVRDSYCGNRTCDLLVSVLIQGTPRSTVGWGTSEFPGQLIALLFVAQWLERWYANLEAQVQSWLKSAYLKKVKAGANYHHSILMLLIFEHFGLRQCTGLGVQLVDSG